MGVRLLPRSCAFLRKRTREAVCHVGDHAGCVIEPPADLILRGSGIRCSEDDVARG